MCRSEDTKPFVRPVDLCLFFQSILFLLGGRIAVAVNCSWLAILFNGQDKPRVGLNQRHLQLVGR